MAVQRGSETVRDDRAIEPGACIRCGGRSRVIADDGHDVCWVCVIAWGRYASLATAGKVEAEEEQAPENAPLEPTPGRDPTVTALLHWSHRTPVSSCPLCRARR